MTYLEFLALFLGIPLAVGAWVFRRHLSARLIIVLAVISALAIAYTGPWDNALIANGVWSYSRNQVIGINVGRVPLEEYAFYVAQVFLAGALTAILLRRA